VAASDEDGTLRVYDLDAAGAPVAAVDVTGFLEPDDAAETEPDVEGAAQIGDRVYWIGSHGRSRKGKERKIRQRLFATSVSTAGGRVTLAPVGVPFKDLLPALVTAPGLARFTLADAAGKAPEAPGGLNIEGMAPTPEGHLLIGFRNPIPHGHAVVARLRNPAALVDGSSTRADVTLAGTLDLGGLGIRAIEFVPTSGVYLVLAGRFDDGDDFALFQWSGEPGAPAQALSADFGGLHPEELIVLPGAGRRLAVRLFSDDGTDACKSAAAAGRRFRSITTHVNL
jgi:DUF971 family protein